MMFYGLAAVIALFALGAVGTKYILRAALYLVGVLMGSAGLYLLLGAEFLAGAQVLVYVGGVVVLLVFAVMLTRTEDLIQDRPSRQGQVLGILGASGFFLSSFFLLKSPAWTELQAPPARVSQIGDLGRSLLDSGATGYLIPFEVISLVLLAVLIGGVVVARTETPNAGGSGHE